jgi:hypothetical protein
MAIYIKEMKIHGYLVGSVIFLFGCFAFLFDAITAKNKPYIIGTLLFTIGSLIYILDALLLEGYI